MSMAEDIKHTSRARAGRWIVLLVSGLVTINGLGWFFVGPSLSTFEQDTGIALAEFRRAYPEAARLIALQARNTAILLVGLGLLGAAGAVTRRDTGAKSAKLGGWAFGAALAGVGLSEVFAGALFGITYLVMGGLALFGQFMAVKPGRMGSREEARR